MHPQRMVLRAIVIAATLILPATTTAAAGRLSITESTFRETWTPLMFASTVEEGAFVTRCNVTLEGSFDYRTIVKSIGTLIGQITRADVAHPCAGSGELTVTSLPWHFTYEGFEGTLPNMTGIRILLRAQIAIEFFEACTYEGGLQGVIRLIRGAIVGITPDKSMGIERIGGSALFCPGRVFSGIESWTVQSLTALGTTTRVTITLI